MRGSICVQYVQCLSFSIVSVVWRSSRCAAVCVQYVQCARGGTHLPVGGLPPLVCSPSVSSPGIAGRPCGEGHRHIPRCMGRHMHIVYMQHAHACVHIVREVAVQEVR